MEKQQGQLVRSLTLGAATILVVSSVIGSGVYKKVAPMSEQLMSPDLVLAAWVLAGIISLCGALSNAEIAGMMAGSGGEYVYFRRIYGRFMAFMWGWSTFAVIKTAAVAGIAYVFTQSLNSIFPLPHLPESIESIQFLIFKPFENAGVKAVTIALIFVDFFQHPRSSGRGGAQYLDHTLVILGLSNRTVGPVFWRRQFCQFSYALGSICGARLDGLRFYKGHVRRLAGCLLGV
jgi:APA family basic amino acid/polyamine antiporter